MVNVRHIHVFQSGGRTRADQPHYIEKGRPLAVVPWDPNEEDVGEALEVAGFTGEWTEVAINLFVSFDERSEPTLAEVED